MLGGSYIITTSFLVFFSFLLICIYQWFNNFTSETTFKILNKLPLSIYIMKDSLRNKFYLEWSKLKTILDSNKIHYWAIAGTALGVQRNNQIIPWDDDIDIGIWEQDAPLITKLLPSIEHCWYGFKFVSDDVPIDIFTFKKVDNLAVYSSNLSRLRWPKEYYYVSELVSFSNANFGPTSIRVSSKNKDYVERAYGSDCIVKCYTQPPHSISWLNRVVWRLNPLICKHFTTSNSQHFLINLHR
jgi:hypothetical protein